MAGENTNTGAPNLPGGNTGAGAKDISNIARGQLKSQGDINNEIRDTVRELDKVSRKYDDINSKLEASNDLNRDVKDLQTDILKSLQKELQLKAQLQSISDTTAASAISKVEKINELKRQEKAVETEINTLLANSSSVSGKQAEQSAAQVKSLTARLNLLAAELETTESSLNHEETKYLAIKKSLEVVEKTTEQLREQEALQAHINSRMGSLGTIAKGLSGVLDKAGLGGFLQIDKTIEKMRTAAKDGASRWKIFGIAMKDSFIAIGDALRNPLFLIGGIYAIAQKLVKSALEYQDKIFNAGKALGLNLTQSQKLFSQFQGIANANGKMALTAKQLVETYSQMNNTLGFMGPKNAEFLATTTGIQRRIGATAEDMQNVQYFSLAAGKSLKDGYASIVGSAKATAAKLKLDMSEKQILEGISKVSATTFNNFKGNVKALAAAVVTATKLGVTLDQIQSAGMNLLDFESSISKEFEAQLLTGKDIDLSRARELALTGKTSELMGELTSKLGSYTEWNEMNVLQQQSYAEALGMTKEAVDEIYKKQELTRVLGAEAGADAKTQYDTLLKQGKTHAEIADLIGRQAAEDALRASASEKLQATMERVNDTIGKMAQALMPMIEGFANFISNAENLRKVFVGIAAVAGGIAATSLAMSVNKARQLASERAIALTNNQLLATQILQTNAQKTQLVTSRGITLTKVAQNTQARIGLAQTQLQAVAERGVATTRIVGAGAAAAAGSGYLGPLALGVGAAVIAGLMAYLGTSGGGGAGGGGSASLGAGISPMNASVANAVSTEKAAGPNKLDVSGASKAGTEVNVVMKVDGVQFGKVTTKALAKDTSVASQDQTTMNPGP